MVRKELDELRKEFTDLRVDVQAVIAGLSGSILTIGMDLSTLKGSIMDDRENIELRCGELEKRAKGHKKHMKNNSSRCRELGARLERLSIFWMSQGENIGGVQAQLGKLEGAVTLLKEEDACMSDDICRMLKPGIISRIRAAWRAFWSPR